MIRNDNLIKFTKASEQTFSLGILAMIRLNISIFHEENYSLNYINIKIKIE